MQKTARNYLFGDETMHLTGELGKSRKMTVWMNPDGTLRIEVLSILGKLQEVEITKKEASGPITTKFDGSCKPVRDEKLSGNPVYEELIKTHEKELPAFIMSLSSIHRLSPSQIELFFPHAADVGEGKAEKPVPQVFPNTAKVQGSDATDFRFYVPKAVADAMHLKGGMQVELSKKGEEIILTPREKIQYARKIYMSWGSRKGTLTTTIPAELIEPMKLSPGMWMQWSKEGENKLSLRQAEGAPWDAVKLQFRKTGGLYPYYFVTIKDEMAEGKAKAGMWGGVERRRGQARHGIERGEPPYNTGKGS